MAISGSRTSSQGISFGDCKVEVNLASAGWADISSWGAEVSTGGGEIPYSELKLFAGPAEVFVGSKGTVDVNVSILYTEGSTTPYRNLRDAYEANNDISCEVRFTPQGDGSGGRRYTTVGGKLLNVPLPNGNSDADEPNVVTFVVQAGSVTSDDES